MRREIAPPQMLQAISLRESGGKTAAEQLQWHEPVDAGQNEGPASRLATKAHGAVKGDIKRLRFQLFDGRARRFDPVLRQVAERKQRHMQPLGRGQSATKRMGRFQDLRYFINARGGLGVGKNCEKQLARLA